MVIMTIDIDKQRVSEQRKQIILDSQYEALFDSVTKLITQLNHLPVALITILDENKIKFKSVVGLTGINEMPHEDTFGGWVINNNQYLEIEDVTKNARHFDHFLVTADTHFRFYAGTPILLPMGEVLGTICVFDTKPNKFNNMQRDTLIGLADIVSKVLVTKYAASVSRATEYQI